MRIALVDCRISAQIYESLGAYADKIIKLPPLSRLSSPVASHPDMLVWCHGGKIVTYEEYLSENAEIFSELCSCGFEIIPTAEVPCDGYPEDVRLNCALVGEKLIAHKRYMSEEILRIASAEGISILHANQGYAKCATAVISGEAVITSDPSIAKAAAAANIDVLTVREGHVRLDGYDTGFIGGACGATEGEVLFCGDIDMHPDAQAIKDFCRRHGKSVVALSTEPLYDYGTVMLCEIGTL